MPAAHARVETFEFLRRLWPAVERAGGRSPLAVLVFIEAEIFPRTAGQRDGLAEFILALGGFGESGIPGEDFAGVPGAERVVEQEVHHVVLGEQLRDRR